MHGEACGVWDAVCGAKFSNAPAMKEGVQQIRDVIVQALLTKRLQVGHSGDLVSVARDSNRNDTSAVDDFIDRPCMTIGSRYVQNASSFMACTWTWSLRERVDLGPGALATGYPGGRRNTSRFTLAPAIPPPPLECHEGHYLRVFRAAGV